MEKEHSKIPPALENTGFFRVVAIITYGHTFATPALEHGMDVKTLSAIIGHISSATTLNVYSHVMDQMKRQAARKIDAGIGGCEATEADLSEPLSQAEEQPVRQSFTPYKGKYRKPGTGCLYQINDHLWEGKYSPKGPDGKRIHKNVYAPTREECEIKLAAMIAATKAEIAAAKLDEADREASMTKVRHTAEDVFNRARKRIHDQEKAD